MFAGVPINLRLCGGRNILLSYGGHGLRVFNINSGGQVVKLGLFRDPGVAQSVRRDLQTNHPNAFRLGCSFSRRHELFRSRQEKIVSLSVQDLVLCSTRSGLSGCLLIGVSGARHGGTLDGIRSFRGFFSVVSSCSGIKCTGVGLLSRAKFTIHR